MVRTWVRSFSFGGVTIAAAGPVFIAGAGAGAGVAVAEGAVAGVAGEDVPDDPQPATEMPAIISPIKS
jgi:hypothetical protein